MTKPSLSLWDREAISKYCLENGPLKIRTLKRGLYRAYIGPYQIPNAYVEEGSRYSPHPLGHILFIDSIAEPGFWVTYETRDFYYRQFHKELDPAKHDLTRIVEMNRDVPSSEKTNT